MITILHNRFGEDDDDLFSLDGTVRRGTRRIRVGLSSVCVIAVALDPRTKDLIGIPDGRKEEVWSHVEQLMIETAEKERLSAAGGGRREDARGGDADVVDISDSRNNQGIKKKFRILSGMRGGVRNLAPDTDNRGSSSSNVDVRAAVAMELTAYRSLDPIDENSDPLGWWQLNCARFQLISHLAKKYLCVPATSAPSERLFSLAGLTLTDNRGRLDPIIASQMIFLRASWETIDDMYRPYEKTTLKTA